MSKIYVIGGMAMDVEGASFNPVLRGDSNPGSVHTNHGGVGRNITENLALIGADVGLISAIGNDDIGRTLMRHLISLGVNVDGIQIINGEETAMYISVLEADGSIDVAIAGMDILNKIDSTIISSYMKEVLKAEMVVLDANLSIETLEYITTVLAGKVPVFIDAVSAPKAAKLKGIAGKFDTIKANRVEAAAITGLPTDTMEEVMAAAKDLLNKGVKNVLITLGKDGAYYANAKEDGLIPPVPVKNLISTTGAGDSFSSVSIFGLTQGWSLRECTKYGIAASSLAIQAEGPVSENLNLRNLRDIVSRI